MARSNDTDGTIRWDFVKQLDASNAVVVPSSSAQTGALTETAPATDIASSGLNGRLQRIAQRLTSLIALVPTSLGAQTSALSLSVTQSTGEFPSSVARLLSAAGTTNSTNVKGSAGRVFCIDGYNAAASTRFLKLYNKATAPTVGSDTPVRTIYLPAGMRFVLDFPTGLSFATGIGYALTTAAADADTGALTVADIVCLNIDYA